ncbi:MAG: AMP-binding protein [Dehalococcoidia bacterium]
MPVPRETLIDFFDDLAKARGPFLVYDDGFRARSYSYEEVSRAARGFAARLADAGLRKGDTVLFWSENRSEWIVAFWGCVLGGIIVVPIDYRSSAEFVGRIGRKVGTKLILTGADVPPLTTAFDVHVWRLQELEWRDGSPSPVALDQDDVVEIVFTSGATGEPKGVVITHRNVLANIVPVEREVKKYRAWARPVLPLRFLNLLPLSHMFGQAMATFVPPMLPGTVIFMRGHNPADIVALIKRRRVSVLVGVPKMLDVLRSHVNRTVPDAAAVSPAGSWLARWWRHRRLHRRFGLKFWSFVVGAAPLDAELEAFWSARGFAVIQGYGLTETAPIVSVTHPLRIQAGSVGTALPGVEVMIADDGEILVRGDNVTRGYFQAEAETARAFEGGWFHTGDIGEIAPDGRLFIRGRKKELIITPEGLKVFPDDVERVLNQIPDVRESAVVGVPSGPDTTGERVHAVLVLGPDADSDVVVREANARLEEHQKIRRGLVWPGAALPRTEGTGKLRRAAVREWVRGGGEPIAAGPASDRLSELLAQYAGRATLAPNTTIDELGLSSLERVELMVALEDAFQTRVDERAFAEARDVGQLRTLVEEAPNGEASPAAALVFPAWNRSWVARAVRRIGLPAFILPLTRVFAWIRVTGRAHLDGVDGPVIFASNHQSYMDTPVIMAALPPRWRYRLAPAMAKEFFAAHFFPEEHDRMRAMATSAGYYLAALLFNAFPLPQREAGARQTLRDMGELIEGGDSVLIFPEGHHTETGDIDHFRAGIGMIASRLDVPVVPVRLEGVDRVLHRTWHMARPGRVRVAFGRPMQLRGTDYEALARRVEDAVRELSPDRGVNESSSPGSLNA